MNMFFVKIEFLDKNLTFWIVWWKTKFHRKLVFHKLRVSTEIMENVPSINSSTLQWNPVFHTREKDFPLYCRWIDGKSVEFSFPQISWKMYLPSTHLGKLQWNFHKICRIPQNLWEKNIQVEFGLRLVDRWIHSWFGSHTLLHISRFLNFESNDKNSFKLFLLGRRFSYTFYALQQALYCI